MEPNIKELIDMAKRKSQEAIDAAELNFASKHYETILCDILYCKCVSV